MALAILGMFVFINNTVPFQESGREVAYKHPSQSVVGARNQPTQFTGKENDSVTISAELRPEVTGGIVSIMALEKMADTGRPWPYIKGNGQFMGSFVITGISIGESQYMPNGKPRSIKFNMTLKKVSDGPLELMGDALGLAVGMARAQFNV